MRALILSDIHANLEALDAVLAAAEAFQQGYDELWNLGDLVGYGGSPNQVIERIRPLETHVVRGNHDRVCCGLTSPAGFNPVARSAAMWTRRELTPKNLTWLQAVPQGPIQTASGEIALAHGSPLDEDEYIVSIRDAWIPLQQMSTPLTFFGHTHVQGGFSQRQQDWNELRTEQQPDVASGSQDTKSSSWTIALSPGTRHLINPGSVGQPRDNDWRAAFAIFDTEAWTISFHRVPYDLIAAQGRILMAGLPERLATRLREGR